MQRNKRQRVNSSQQNRLSDFERLPQEVLLNVFRFCKKSDLAHLAAVSKKINPISNDDQLWVDNVITGAILKKMNMSAKDLYRYRKLFLDGNYAQAMDEKIFKDTLVRLAKQCEGLDFGATIMPGLANNLNVGYPKLSYHTTRGMPLAIAKYNRFF